MGSTGTSPRGPPSVRSSEATDGASPPSASPVTESGAHRRYWQGLPSAGSGRRARFRHRWSRLDQAVVLVAILEVIFVAGALTGWFGVPTLLSKASAPPPSGPAGPDPNPFNEKVDAVIGEMTYSGNETGYFPALQGENLCSDCPMLPVEDTHFDPPRAVLRVFFNLTNTGLSYHTATYFSIVATASPQSGVFELFNMYCCDANDYDEDVDQVGLSPGMTLTLEAFIYATNIPSLGGQGYTLYLDTVSSN